MKPSLLLMAIISLLIFTGCREEELPYRPPDLGTPPAPILIPPDAYAGEDRIVELPVNETVLRGESNEWDPDLSFSWRKISGPDSLLIVSKDALQTRVLELEKGIYEFELSVSDKKSLTSKDTAMVIVGALSSNPSELVFNFQNVDQFFEGAVFVFYNFYNYIPRGSFFKVFVKRDTTAAWEEGIQPLGLADNYPYSFSLWDGNLWVWSSGPSLDEKSQVKIVYD